VTDGAHLASGVSVPNDATPKAAPCGAMRRRAFGRVAALTATENMG
jgi:hypothetical protein